MKDQEDGMMKNASDDGDASMLQNVLRIRLSESFWIWLLHWYFFVYNIMFFYQFKKLFFFIQKEDLKNC